MTDDDRCPLCGGTGKASPETILARSMKSARMATGMSQAELAKRLDERGLGIDPTGITRMEQGKRSITLNEAVAIREILTIRY